MSMLMSRNAQSLPFVQPRVVTWSSSALRTCALSVLTGTPSCVTTTGPVRGAAGAATDAGAVATFVG